MHDTIPSREECLLLMKQEGMLPNIVSHSLIVEKVAVFLAQALRGAGERLNLQEVIAGALLHDITKTRSIHTHENHALSGELLLRSLGYLRIADIVRYHIELPLSRRGSSGLSAEEVVNYADKRVCQDSVVSLAERFRDLTVRYGKNADSCDRLWHLKKQTYEVEAKIFMKVNFEPFDLPRLVNA